MIKDRALRWYMFTGRMGEGRRTVGVLSKSSNIKERKVMTQSEVGGQREGVYGRAV